MCFKNWAHSTIYPFMALVLPYLVSQVVDGILYIIGIVYARRLILLKLEHEVACSHRIVIVKI